MAVPLMQEFARNRLTKRQVMLIPEFEHTSHCFFAARLLGARYRMEGCFLGE